MLRGGNASNLTVQGSHLSAGHLVQMQSGGATSLNVGGGYTSSNYSLVNSDGGRASGTPASGVGVDDQGQATTPAGAGGALPSLNGFSATAPVALGASDHDRSTTQSGLSGGLVTLNGQTTDTRTEGLTDSDGKAVNTTLTTGQTPSGALHNNLDVNAIQTGFAVTQTTSTFLDNRAREADAKTAQAKDNDRKANDPTNGLSDTERQALRDASITLRQEAQTITDDWGAGGTYRQVLTALTAGAAGNVTGGTGQFVQDMVINYIQQQGATYIGDLVAQGALIEGSPEHAALHAIVACAGAAASSQSCGSGAEGAAASSLLTGLFSATSPDETQSERQAKAHLIETLVTGLATATGASPATATSAATTATENNWLATQQVVQMKKELQAADGVLEQLKVRGKWGYVSAKQDVLTATGVGKGLAEAGWNDIQGLAEFLSDPIAGLNGLKQLIADENARQNLSDSVFRELDAKIDRMQTALEQGGDQQAEQLGKDLGALIWQVGTVATGVGGAAKAGAKLADVGISLGSKTLGDMAKQGLLKNAGAIDPVTGKPALDLNELAKQPGRRTDLKEATGEFFGQATVKDLMPEAEYLGGATGAGQKGIDGIYKLKGKDGQDYYVFVENKYNTSKQGGTNDGLQGSEGWLLGSNRIENVVGKDVATNVENAVRNGRTDTLLIRTLPDGRTEIKLLDASGKPQPFSNSSINLLGRLDRLNQSKGVQP